MYLAQLVLLERSSTTIHRAGNNSRLGLAVLNLAASLVAARPEFDGFGFVDYRSHRFSSIIAAMTMKNSHTPTAIDGRTLTCITFIDWPDRLTLAPV
jgi:hypothetical protein